MKSFISRMFLGLMLILTVPAIAAPGLIHYQGRLTNPSGQPITTPFDITFTFWDAETSGAQLGGFSDADTVTADANGIYSTLIGDDPGNLIPASVFAGNSVWLNVQINGENLTPRKRIVSVGYALRADMATTATYSPTAGNADKVDGKDSSAFAATAHNHAAGNITSGMFSDALVTDTLTVSLLGSVNGGAIKSGTVAAARIDAAIARDTEIMPAVLAGDGAGSTLDADKLDGKESSAFAATAHNHAAGDITSGMFSDALVTDTLSVSLSGSVNGGAIKSGTVAAARIDAAIARDSEILPAVLAGDGPGSTLDADTLDGQQAAAFMAAASDNWVNTTGDTMTGALNLENVLNVTFDTGGTDVSIINNGTGRGLLVTRGGAGGLSALRSNSAGDSAIWGQGSTATAEGVTAISTGGADALDAQAQGALGRAGDFGITNAANPGPALVAATAGTGQAALLDGRVDIGANGSNTGDLRVFSSSAANKQIHAHATSSGGFVDLFDEAGSFLAGVEADTTGAGGFAYVYRSAADQGFIVDGNTGANEPRVTISGSARAAVFDMANSGSNSVELPTSAISAAECLDEPGVASNTEGSAGVAIASTTLTPILSRSITAPSSGYVLVLGTSQVEISHVTGTNDLYNFGVSDDAAILPVNQDLFVTVIAALPTGTYEKVLTAHGLFSVGAGAHTFYLLGQKTSAASDDATAFDVQLTLVYFATAYGTVTPTIAGNSAAASSNAAASANEDVAPRRTGMTPVDLQTEREESIAADRARLERELAEMRTRFDALQKDLEANMRAQRAAGNEPGTTKPVRRAVEAGR